MNTTAANQADRQIELVAEDPLGDIQARWSSDDDLLVWTVSRIEGGRRHGIERDCHVVYALSRGFFVEQTRKFRASAEQCIEMLQQGKRAGSTQRKVALDSIIAIKSDPASGRLQIRTLNGTHHLQPVSNEEADVLRQIGSELALRMPAGGASFSDYSGPLHAERRRAQIADSTELAERERYALAALENARVEDAPDAYMAPQYHLPDEGQYGEGQYEAAGESEIEAVYPVTPESNVPVSIAATDLQRIAAAVRAEMGAESEPSGQLPADITVAGGVEITFEPAPEHASSAPVAQPLPDYHAEYSDAPVEIEPGVVIPGQDAYDRPIPNTGELPEHFDRRQQRALRRQIEGGEDPVVDDSAVASFPDPSQASVVPAPERLGLPSGAVYQPVAEISTAEPAAAVATHPHLSTPAMPAEFSTEPTTASVDHDGEEDRREIEDPNFPSIFDRRGAHPPAPVERPGWARLDDEDDEVAAAVDTVSESVVEVEVSNELLPEGPPTLSIPSSAQTTGMGGAVGFNPDFDVNPFR